MTKTLLNPKFGISTAAKIILSSGIRGLRDTMHLEDIAEGGDGAREYLNVEYVRGWAVSCSLSVTMSTGELRQERDGSMLMTAKPKVELSWSSTGRSVAVATAALALYREVLDLAAEIEAVLAEENFGVRRSP